MRDHGQTGADAALPRCVCCSLMLWTRCRVSNRLGGTDEWLVIHHTACGIENLTQEKMAEKAGGAHKSGEGDYINWLTIKDRVQSVKDDVKRLRDHPLTPKDVSVSGFIYDIETGLLNEVDCG